MKLSLSYIRFYFFFTAISFCACSQDSQVVVHQQYLGETVVRVQHTSFKKASPLLFVHLHHNEETAAAIADSVSREAGIEFLQIINDGKRLLDFTLDERSYRVDPNRIFSRDGAIASLSRHGQASEDALIAVDRFQYFLTSFFTKSKTLIALHNNTDGDLSVERYQLADIGLVSQNPEHDPDDFFITTDSLVFTKLKKRGYNVALEDVTKVTDDGSMSVYCAKRGIRYINIEAQHGHYREQRNMLAELLELLEE